MGNFLCRTWCLFLTTTLLPALAEDLPLLSWEGQTMGSTYTVKLVDARLSEQGLAALKGEIEQRLTEINRQMSHYQPDSKLSRFNRAPAQQPFRISADFGRVLRLALDLNRSSHGAFEP